MERIIGSERAEDTHWGALKITVLNLDLRSFGNLDFNADIRGGNYLFFEFECLDLPQI